MAPWLILIHRIPPTPLYLRARIRQRLAAAGAVAVKKSVYLLPKSDEALEDLQWIAQEITAGGGDAHLVEGVFVDPAATDAAIEQFRQARNADYRALAAAAEAAVRTRGAAAAAQTPARLARRLDQIRRLDFFAAEGRRQAEKAVAAVAAKAARKTGKDRPMKKAATSLRGRTWVTRPGVKVDRIASAWFIRRFIDPKARFRFEDPGSARRSGDVRFDMAGGDFTHEGDRCTLETLIQRLGLPDPAVRAIAEIVHDIDLKDDKFERPETAGVAALIEGVARRHARDAARIEEGLLIFDGLHEALARGRRPAP